MYDEQVRQHIANTHKKTIFDRMFEFFPFRIFNFYFMNVSWSFSDRLVLSHYNIPKILILLQNYDYEGSALLTEISVK